MKIFINNARENWVVDRFIHEWNNYNYKQKRNFFGRGTIIWLISPWTWKKIPKKFLKKNKVVCTIHHIDEDKFDDKALFEFQKRDKYIDLYHVISEKTEKQVKKITKKQIKKIPFWVNDKLWFQIESKEFLYEKYDLDKNNFHIGSFQRDTEGSDLISPKLSKGPDQFLDIVKYYNENYKNLVVLLAGKRRQYLINNLEKEGIKYRYLEMVSFQELNELYNLLNLYIVSSRFEGGPQAIMECALSKTPIISTDVGIASEILSNSSIYNMDNFKEARPDPEAAYRSVQKYIMPKGFDQFNKMFEAINEN